MVNAQEYLDKNYPKEERSKKTKLHISNRELKGDLVFTGFDNLERLDCSENELTSLDISSLTALKEVNCYTNKLTKLITNNLETSSRLENLEYLDCTNNYLTDINSLLLGLNHNKLRKFYLSDNTFSTSDLIPFSKFVNLEELTIASNYYRKDHDKGITNCFVGSLKPLND